VFAKKKSSLYRLKIHDLKDARASFEIYAEEQHQGAYIVPDRIYIVICLVSTIGN
jgi:hypothetical protein